MSALLLAIAGIGAGLATSLLEAARPRIALGVGIAGALVASWIAFTMRSGDGLAVGGTLIAGSGGLRAVGLAWAGGIVLLGLLQAAAGTPPGVVGPALMGLGAAALALGNADGAVAVAFLTAGGIVSVAAASLGADIRARERGASAAEVARRSLRAVTVSGGIAYLVLAWGASPAGPVAITDPLGVVDPAFATAAGIAILGIAAAVALRSAVIPVHLWGARLAGSASPGALPAALGWGSAAFAITALGWLEITILPVDAPLQAERAAIAVVAIASIALGGAAAYLHDDLAHVLGYSLVQDAGLVLLAFASSSPTAAVPAREWILGMAAVKTALAAWVLAIEAASGTARLAELGGWARRRPLLAVGFGLIVVGAVGVPGMATFAARASLVTVAVPGPLAALVLLTALTPIAYLGRILVVGLRRGTATGDAEPGAGMAEDRPDLSGFRSRGWSRPGLLDVVTVTRRLVRDNRAPIASAVVLATALLGLAVATSGPGSVPFGPAEGGPVPVASAAPSEAAGSPGPGTTAPIGGPSATPLP